MVNRQFGIMGWESVDVVRYDLGPLLQGQTRKAKLKSAYNSFIIIFFFLLFFSMMKNAITFLLGVHTPWQR